MKDLKDEKYWEQMNDDIAAGKYENVGRTLTDAEAEKVHQLVQFALIGDEIKQLNQRLTKLEKNIPHSN
jgi:molybdopterin biosynthesis enzyme MoaB